VRAVTSLAIPQPSQLVDVLNLCQSVEAQLPHVDDVAALKDAAAKMRAIDQYVALTSTEGRQAIAATVRRIEVRVGEVLGAPMPGTRTDLQPLGRDQEVVVSDRERHDFRQMAAHPEIVEAEIAKGTDERPTSRRQVMQAIRDTIRSEEEQLAHELASRGIEVLSDPAAIAANKSWIAMDAAVASVIRQVLDVSARYSNDDLESLQVGRLWQSTRQNASRASAFLNYLSGIGGQQ
jgi:hypothetical protein